MYRKIEVKVWSDQKFRRLSPVQPSGQALWFYLLTGPQSGIIPGLFRAGHASLAEELGWDMKAFEEAFAEVFREGLLKDSPKDRLIWIPKAIKHNPPASPNVVRSWASALNTLPECDLLNEALEAIREEVYSLDKTEVKGFAKAFAEVFGEGFPKAFAEGNGNPSPNQKQKQKQNTETGEREERDADAPLPPAESPERPASTPETNPLPFLSAWYGEYHKRTARMIAPSGDDRKAALEAMKQLGGDNELALECVDHYWAHWQELFFATKQTTRSRPVNQRESDWTFRSFAKNIVACIPAVKSTEPPDDGFGDDGFEEPNIFSEENQHVS